MKLRQYQTDAKIKIGECFSNDVTAVILCAPTGSGKTVTFADMASEAVRNGFNVIIVVDRKELLEQAKDKLITYGLKPSIITGGRRGRLGHDIYIATVQTLVKRVAPEVDLIIIDEAHKQIFDKLFDIDAYKEKLFIGATATPIRTGKMTQLSKNYKALIETTSIGALLKEGYLVPAITYGTKVDMDGIDIKGGDYDEEQMFAMFNKPKLYDGVVDNYKKFANNTKAICFNINIEHSKETCKHFNDAGIPAVHLDGKTPKAEREKILRGLERGFFKVLCNVDILTTGFDMWTIQTVIVNRATRSLPLWLQMGGRGSRPTPKEFEGNDLYLQKSHFNLIDMGGNVFRLGFWEQERQFSLDHKIKEKVDAAPVKVCPEDEKDLNDKKGCGALVPASSGKCKVCGFEFPAPEIKITPLSKGEFLPLEYENTLPADLIGVAWGNLPLKDLERVRVSKGYKLGWIIKQIMLRKDLDLLEYARMREFNNPEGWVAQVDRRNAEASQPSGTQAIEVDKSAPVGAVNYSNDLPF